MKKLYQKASWIAFLTAILLTLSAPVMAQKYMVRFNVFHDSLQNCSRDTFEKGIKGVRLVMEFLPSGLKTPGISPTSGLINLLKYAQDGDTLLRAYSIGTSSLGFGCETYYEFSISPDTSLNDTTFIYSAPIPIRAGQCAQMGVDISGGPPRPCFDQVYSVQAYNQGLDVAEDVYVEVKLDSNLIFQTSSIPATALPGHRWRFDLGDFQSLASNQFTITYQLDCDVSAGQVICSDAIVYPDTVCVEGTGWNAAIVLASVACIGDSVVVKVRNTRNIPTTTGLNYIIAEDMIMYRQEMLELGPLDSIEWSIAANGATWHISADQEPGYPYHVYTNATIEGCGTNQSGGISSGIFLQYPYSSGLVNRGKDCQEAVEYYEQNRQQGFPSGIGPSHQIRVGDEIKYQILFQNNSTDTVGTVVIRAKLAEGLDPNSIILGAASHPYTYNMNQDGEMHFVFPDISLPDSLSSPSGSQGYLNFKAKPLADLPTATVISSNAAIYFDSNPAIVTNTSFHSIGLDYATVKITSAPKSDFALEIFPNPSDDLVHFVWKNHRNHGWKVNLFDSMGTLVQSAHTHEDMATLACRGRLNAGLYFFQFVVENQIKASGTIILK